MGDACRKNRESFAVSQGPRDTRSGKPWSYTGQSCVILVPGCLGQLDLTGHCCNGELSGSRQVLFSSAYGFGARFMIAKISGSGFLDMACTVDSSLVIQTVGSFSGRPFFDT